jgi:hypothetical protein
MNTLNTSGYFTTFAVTSMQGSPHLQKIGTQLKNIILAKILILYFLK